MVSEGCFLGCVQPTRVHMLVCEEALTLNQPQLSALCIGGGGGGGAGEREEAVTEGEEPDLTSVARVSTGH